MTDPVQAPPPAAPDPDTRCPELKRGKFARLRCIHPTGHAGAHDFRILGVREDPPHRPPGRPPRKHP